MLVDRGVLDLDAKVAEYWPEFAVKGKDKVTVRHILSHMSGVSGWDAPFEDKDMYDLEASTARLAAQAPWWEPGTSSGYHASNYGHLIGELVRRTTGKSIREFIDEEIARPLGADFQIGALESDSHRIAELIAPPPADIAAFSSLDPNLPAVKTLLTPPPNALKANTLEWRLAQIAAVNGHTNARALARIFSAVALGGEIDGVRLLSQQTIDQIFDVQYEGVDLVLFCMLRWGVGYGLPHVDSTPWIPQEHVMFWPGWGGSILLVDVKKQMTIAYVMNKMGNGVLGSERTRQYVETIYDVVNQLHTGS
ncbi:beta-lactamase [Talaromyces proteolyticus]|uniref:Beta-lactamase n=1 Tax=Talaromyces proteolyticus TaxID=1131652 RepID=A0AAD4KWW4_9EURO|nr:beta-lactamase [Talaromyces proteolyticus]KAH8700968.1 beta-lactamase [Talaromyces proteolyticus]